MGQRKSNYFRLVGKTWCLNFFTKKHTSPVEGNFCDQSDRAVKPHVKEDHNTHMGYVDKLDRMVNTELPGEHGSGLRNCFSTQHKWLSLMPSCYIKHMVVKMTNKRFREILVCNLIKESHEKNMTATGVSRGRLSPSVSQISHLEVKHSQHWSSKEKQCHCRACAMKNKRSEFVNSVWG